MIGGPPAWATKLVKPDTMPSTNPRGFEWRGTSPRGGNSRRCARNSSVSAPTTPATACRGISPNSSVPTTVPSRPAGSSRRSSAGSRSRHSCCSPAASITSSSGSITAAACGTAMVRAISGVASEPKPAAKPLLARPISSTAGIAAA